MKTKTASTIIRVVSGILLGLFVLLLIFAGKNAALFSIGIIGCFIIDEINTNFLQLKRNSFSYIISLMIYLGIYFSVHFMLDYNQVMTFSQYVVYAGIVINVLLMAYLFGKSWKKNFFVSLFQYLNIFVHFIILIPILCLSFLTLYTDNWQKYFLGFLFINVFVDSFAWLFGTTMGKHKLWPSVSPKKSYEGLIGGVLAATIICSLYWYYVIGQLHYIHIVFFIVLGLFSQCGDLIQSKMKRSVGIKDSSGLIPGHGGAYDRMDGLIFIAPFLAFLTPYF